VSQPFLGKYNSTVFGHDVRKKRFIAHITTVFTTAAASAVTWTSVMDISSARCIGDSDNITMLLSPEITNFTEI